MWMVACVGVFLQESYRCRCESAKQESCSDTTGVGIQVQVFMRVVMVLVSWIGSLGVVTLLLLLVVVSLHGIQDSF